jgi:hypothetical protein
MGALSSRPPEAEKNILMPSCVHVVEIKAMMQIQYSGVATEWMIVKASRFRVRLFSSAL